MEPEDEHQQAKKVFNSHKMRSFINGFVKRITVDHMMKTSGTVVSDVACLLFEDR